MIYLELWTMSLLNIVVFPKLDYSKLVFCCFVYNIAKCLQKIDKQTLYAYQVTL